VVFPKKQVGYWVESLLCLCQFHKTPFPSETETRAYIKSAIPLFFIVIVCEYVKFHEKKDYS